ncbi:MAG: hypothetical protein HZC01_04185 [Candidatus Kerfeldbacteria bacterium]|nr:hypothetical protein [Candidatus Kerfeldbacteria bacterium]
MKKIRIITIIVGCLVIVLAAGAIVLRHVPAVTYAVEDVDTTAHWGSISGSLSYPSDFIPALGVCAQTKNATEQYCTYKMLEDDKYTNGVGYSIAVPPGAYTVFSHEVTELNALTGYQDGDYQAFYSKFVTCGGTSDCTSHTPVVVTVERNQDLENIDPIDWYNI